MGCGSAQGADRVIFLDPHVEGVTHHADGQMVDRLDEFHRLVQSIDQVGFVPVPRLHR